MYNICLQYITENIFIFYFYFIYSTQHTPCLQYKHTVKLHEYILHHINVDK